MINKTLIEIENDVLNIVQAIKSIDNKYRVFYNAKKSRIELYSQRGMNLNLELVCPYQKLDNRFLLKVKQTRIENAKKIILEMERNNAKILKDIDNKILDESKIKAKEMIEYGDKKSTDIDFSNAYTTEWF